MLYRKERIFFWSGLGTYEYNHYHDEASFSLTIHDNLDDAKKAIEEIINKEKAPKVKQIHSYGERIR